MSIYATLWALQQQVSPDGSVRVLYEDGSQRVVSEPASTG